MPALLIYLLQSSLALTLLYGIYWGMLRKLTFYQFNRIVLLLMIVGSLLLPSLRMALPNTAIKQWIIELDESFSIPGDKLQSTPKVLPSGSNPSVTIQPQTEALDKKQPATPKTFPILGSHSATLLVGKGLLGFYLLVAVFFIGKIFFELLGVFALTKTGSRQQVNSCRVIYAKACPAPLSFFKVIILNPDLFTPAQLEQIIRHERVHAQQWHSLDVLLVELFGAIFWFHPMAYLLKKEVKLNLEYIADRQVLRQGFNRKMYQYNLLQISSPTTPIPVANYFNFSLLKSRIYQMNINPSPRQAMWRYGSLLPAIALLLLAIQPMNAARNESVQKASRPLANTLGTTSAAQAKSGTSIEPIRSQSALIEPVIQPLSRTETIHTETIPSHAKSKEATSAEPVAHFQSSDTLLADEPIVKNDLKSIAELGSKQPINVDPEDVEPINSPVNPLQTTKASALNPYLNLETSHSIYLAIRASLDEHALGVMEKTLQEKGVQVTFTNVRYNAQRQLTRVRMQVSIGNCTKGEACFDQTIEAYNGGEPLQNDKPLVFYLSRRADQVGVYFGYPQDLPPNDLSALHNITGIMVGIYGSN